jgi:hypothetical protein
MQSHGAETWIKAHVSILKIKYILKYRRENQKGGQKKLKNGTEFKIQTLERKLTNNRIR